MIFNIPVAGKLKVSCTFLGVPGETLTFEQNGVTMYTATENTAVVVKQGVYQVTGSVSGYTKTITVKEIFEEDTINSNKFLPFVKDETIESLPEAIKSLKVIEVYEDEVYEKDGVTLKGSWKYLLTDQDTGKVDDSITITDMQKMIDNMQTNIHTATLFEMKDDGVLSELSDDMLETKLKTSIGGQSLSVTFPGKTKLGDLTVDEMLTYLDHILSHLPA